MKLMLVGKALALLALVDVAISGDAELIGDGSCVKFFANSGSVEATITAANFNAILSDIATLKAGKAAADAKIAALEAGKVAADAKIATLEAGKSAADTKIATLETAKATHDSQIATLQSGKSAADTKISALESGKATADSKIATLESGKVTSDSRITAVEAAVDTIKKSLPAVVSMGTQSYGVELTGNGYHGVTKVRYYAASTIGSTLRLEYPLCYMVGTSLAEGWKGLHAGCGNTNGVASCTAVCKTLGRSYVGLTGSCGSGYPSPVASYSSQCTYTASDSPSASWYDYGATSTCGNPMYYCDCTA